jgi:hypothetical protein
MTSYQIGKVLKDLKRQLAYIDKEIIELKAALAQVSKVSGVTSDRCVTSQALRCSSSYRRRRSLQTRKGYIWKVDF